MSAITIIGSISGRTVFDSERISALLARQRAPISCVPDILGHPITEIYQDETALIKLQTELDWVPAVMEKWAQSILEKERRLGVYHPDRTWFLATRGNETRCLVGNVSPLLNSLQQALLIAPATPLERARRLGWFEKLFHLYFKVAADVNARLDENLANFGVDSEGGLHYVNDDVFRWDDAVSLPHMVGAWVRAFGWMDTPFCKRLGEKLRVALAAHPDGARYAPALSQQLRGLFMPNPGRQEALIALSNALLQVGAEDIGKAFRPPPRRNYLALISDLHGNLPALEAAIEFLKEQGITEGLCLGDVVGYGPHPRECIERLAELGYPTIRGNHDHAAGTGVIPRNYSQDAAWSLNWTTDILSRMHRHWLAELPLFLEGEQWLAVHGSPADPRYFSGYVYGMTFVQNLAVLEERGIHLCFHGHTHIPSIYAQSRDKRSIGLVEPGKTLLDYQNALVNPGSVGQPRNRQPGAHLAIWDRAENSLRFFRISYDLEKIIRDMRDQGFPETLWQRLRQGE
jgi:predicted phosphodiesterase